MKLLYDGLEYAIDTEVNQLVTTLKKLIPLKLKPTRSAEHEYYAALPGNVSVDGAKTTSYVKAG